LIITNIRHRQKRYLVAAVVKALEELALVAGLGQLLQQRVVVLGLLWKGGKTGMACKRKSYKILLKDIERGAERYPMK